LEPFLRFFACAPHLSSRTNNNYCIIVIIIGESIPTMAKRKCNAPATSKAIAQQQAWVT
jgi:hypothetical protein